MADITAADVTYADVSGTRRLSGMPPHVQAIVTISFGDGALTYPAGGIPLLASQLGFPNGHIESVIIVDSSDATNTHLWTYDIVSETIRGYSAEATELTGAVAATTLRCQVVGD